MNGSTRENATSLLPVRMLNTTVMSTFPILAWSAAYGTVAVMAAFGNSMVIVAFSKNAKLHTRTNFFVIGLAAADFLVGVLAVPLFICTFWYYTRRLQVPEVLTRIYDAADIFAGFASIFQLVLISLERWYAIIYPISHRNSSKLAYLLSLAFFWFLSGALSLTQSMGKEAGNKHDLKKAFFTMIWMCYGVSFLVICAAYVGIWKKAKKRGTYGLKRKRKRQDREVMIAVTVLIVIVVFIITWLPFFTVNILFFYDPKKGVGVPYQFVQFTKLLHYSNSAINPIIYSLKIPGFKKTFTSLLRRESRPMLTRTRTLSFTRRDSYRNSILRKPNTSAA